MSQTAAQLNRIRDEARTCVLMVCTADADVTDGRVEVDVDILGYDDEETIAWVAGGVRGPFGLPRSGELWFGALLGSGLNEAVALVPLTRFDSTDLPISELGVTSWTPPVGEEIRIETRDAGVRLTSAEAIDFSASDSIRFQLGGLSVEMTSAGKLKMGKSSVEVVDALSKTLGFLSDTLRDLAATQVVTLLGPQPLITAPLFTARQLTVTSLKTLIDTHLKG